MDDTCGNESFDYKTQFWNLKITWYTETPDFTNYFQQIVFVLVPCLVFCLVAVPYYFCHCKKNRAQSLPWTPLLILKLMLCLCLVAVSIGEILNNVLSYHQTSYIGLYSHGMKIVTFTLIMLILLQHRTNGVKSSSLLFIFWLISSICAAIMFRSTLLKVFSAKFQHISQEKFILEVICYPLIWCEFILSIFVDAKNFAVTERKSPIEEVPSFLYLFHFWMSGTIFKSIKKLVTIEDFAPLSVLLRAGNQWRRFEAAWKFNTVKRLVKDPAVDIKQPNSSFICAAIKAFWPWLLYSVIYEILFDFTSLVPPLILDLIISFVKSSEEVWKGYLYCFAIFIAFLLNRYIYNGSICYPTLSALQIKTAFMSAVYRKVLKLSSSARKKYTCGEMVNLTAVDIDRIFEFVLFFTFVIGGPLRIILTLLLLWKYLGVACLAGVAVMLVLISMTLVIAKINNAVQVKQMAMKDIRMKYMSEILGGIKVLKLWAWEVPFMKKIMDIRQKEVSLIRKFQLCYAASSFFYNCTPFLMAVVCFTTYVLMDEKNILYPNTAFVSLILLNNLKFSLFLIPSLISKIIQCRVSLHRLKCFLMSEENDPCAVGNNPDEDHAVCLRNISFSWGLEEEMALKNINLHVKKGELVAVIGVVGAGKSSLLSACLGNLYKKNGSIDIQGTLAYVPQQAWIQNKSVRDNVLFVKPMNKKIYDAVLDVCCLRPDLKILPGGDKTEIGEKGVNLSGGQKQRISLARAVYQNADVYLLDDPLSAVDAHVGKEIFENVIGNHGYLKNKTRILVTHSLAFLPDVDVIICMKEGRIEEIGTYEYLMGHNGPFAEFIQKHGTQTEVPDEKKEEEMISSSLISPCEGFELIRSDSINKFSTSCPLSLSSDLSALGTQLIEEEHMEIGKVKRSLYLNYIKHAGVVIMAFAVFGYFSFQVLEVSANVWLSEWSKDPVHVNMSLNVAQRNYRITIYTILGFCEAVATVFGTVLLAIGAARASRIYHMQMLDSIMKSPMSFFDTTPSGRVMNRFGKDIDVIDIQIPIEFDAWLVCAFIVLGTFVVIAMTTPEFLLALIPVGIVYYFIQKFYLIAARQIKRMESIRRSPVFSFFAETVQGVSCIKAYNVETQFVKEFESKVDENVLCYYYWSSSNRWLSFMLDVVSSFILLTASILAVYNRSSLDEAKVGLSLTYALTVTDALTWLIRTGVELENQSVSVERIHEYSNLTPEAPWDVPSNQPPENWPKKGIVKFQNYSTVYREGLDLVLKKINLEIVPGEKFGIVGRTGAGKSSVTLALFRIIEPVEGSIFIDDTDITKIGLHTLRSQLTIIPQDPVLFTGNLRLNLDPNEFYSDSDLWVSLEHAHLKAFVSSLPEGLNYDITEGGENLSVGQRQLICLARALLKKTKILVLDEATAAVDVATDSLIQETIRTDFSDHTVIAIAHRLNTVMDYDRVVVMEAGNIIEIGKPTDLLQDPNSHFFQMARNAGIV